jgi:hypothetical protein
LGIAATIIIVLFTYFYLFPSNYDQCIAIRMPFTTSQLAASSIIGACRAEFPRAQDCQQRLLEPSEISLLAASANIYAGGDMFITIYNGNRTLEMKNAKFTVTETASGTIRTYAFDEDILPLSTRMSEVKVFLDNSKPMNWTWQIIEASACVK